MTVHENCRKHKRPYRIRKDGKKYCPICECPFEGEIHHVIHKENRNVLIIVEGPPGTGKSYFCLALAADLDPNFYERPGLTFELLGFRILFKPAMFTKVLRSKELYKGAVVIIEEGGVQADHRKWYSFNNMVFNYILQTFRFMNLIVIVNVPVIQFIDSDAQKLFMYHIETVKVDYTEKLNVVKIKRQTYNSTVKKTYQKFLRYKVNGRFIKFVTWKFPRADKKLCRLYERLHRTFKAGLIEELAREMKLLDKQEDIKKQRVLINEKDAVAQVIANPEIFTKELRGRTIVDGAMVETKFNVGRGIGERIKKAAEYELNKVGE